MIERAYCTVAHGQMHYRHSEMGKRPLQRPLILLHQTPSSSAMYEALMAELMSDFTCITPDTPGFGQSDSLVGEQTVAGYATAVSQCLQKLDISKCFVFGHHTGASIAVQLTVDHPELVSKLILSGPPLLTEAQINYLKTTLPAMELDENGRFLNDLWQRLRSKDTDVSLELALRETVAALQCRDNYHAAYHAVFAQDFTGQLTQIDCPVLLMAGEQDSLRASLEPAAALVKNGRVEIIPDAGTYICDQKPQIVAQHLRKFLL